MLKENPHVLRPFSLGLLNTCWKTDAGEGFILKTVENRSRLFPQYQRIDSGCTETCLRILKHWV